MVETAAEKAAIVARWLATIAVTGLLGLALVTVADVLGRYLFAAPIRGFVDIAALTTAIIAAACFPALLIQRGNVTLKLFEKVAGGRLRRFFDAFGALVTAVFFALMTWQYVRYAAEMTSGGERMATLRWPVGPWWWIVTAMIAVAAVTAAIVFLVDARRRD